jgi:DNA-directed RNA polymerase subunit RPC12/RpoP
MTHANTVELTYRCPRCLSRVTEVPEGGLFHCQPCRRWFSRARVMARPSAEKTDSTRVGGKEGR